MQRSRTHLLAVSLVAALLAGCGGGYSSSPLPQTAQQIPDGGPQMQSTAVFPATASRNVAASCATLLPGDDMRCFALYRTDAVSRMSAEQAASTASRVYGYTPGDLRSAYNLPSRTRGYHQTVAIVDAYDDPNAENDLNVYRAHFSLRSCTTANGCFKKVNQYGGPALPKRNGGWAQEISLDLDMASAICPHCHILLVEANNATGGALGRAVDTAVKLGATVISNSYGGDEWKTESGNAVHYNHPKHIIVASSGDNGEGTETPAVYATVVAVGGTSLSRNSSARGWGERAWSFAGSGCSSFIAKPAWQNDAGCPKRSESDVSAVADPNTGVAVYDSYAFQGSAGWMVFGGTSVSAPIIAAVYALAGNAASINAPQFVWKHGGTRALHDVRQGQNGVCPSLYTYICQARRGYDGPTGWGTPNGIAAF